jgi:S-adenosylmethionine-diacylglycerol 3-amino-3-carboxypropyl transferase
MAKHYFENLNYTLGNEDTKLEQDILAQYPAKKILAICGSGGRSLALLSKGVEILTLVDLGEGQLNLARLRLATYTQLDFNTFIRFWGYPPGSPEKECSFRQQCFSQLQLDQSLRDFWQPVFEQLQWQSPLYIGKWERTFALMAKVARLLLGAKFDQILQHDNLEEQVRFYQQQFPRKRWNILIAILGNKSFFNALLYKGHFIEKNVGESYIEYYREAFERLFTTQIARRSFFVNLCFYGRLMHPDANPVEAQPHTHAAIQAAMNAGAQVNFEQANVMQLTTSKTQYDFISMSDVPSYFKGDLEHNFMQQIKNVMAPGGICVNRYYLRVCNADISGLNDVTPQFAKSIAQESVQMYRPQILQR